MSSEQVDELHSDMEIFYNIQRISVIQHEDNSVR